MKDGIICREISIEIHHQKSQQKKAREAADISWKMRTQPTSATSPLPVNDNVGRTATMKRLVKTVDKSTRA